MCICRVSYKYHIKYIFKIKIINSDTPWVRIREYPRNIGIRYISDTGTSLFWSIRASQSKIGHEKKKKKLLIILAPPRQFCRENNKAHQCQRPLFALPPPLQQTQHKTFLNRIFHFFQNQFFQQVDKKIN